MLPYYCDLFIVFIMMPSSLLSMSCGLYLQARFLEAAVAYKKKIGFNGILVLNLYQCVIPDSFMTDFSFSHLLRIVWMISQHSFWIFICLIIIFYHELLCFRELIFFFRFCAIQGHCWLNPSLKNLPNTSMLLAWLLSNLIWFTLICLFTYELIMLGMIGMLQHQQISFENMA